MKRIYEQILESNYRYDLEEELERLNSLADMLKDKFGISISYHLYEEGISAGTNAHNIPADETRYIHRRVGYTER